MREKDIVQFFQTPPDIDQSRLNYVRGLTSVGLGIGNYTQVDYGEKRIIDRIARSLVLNQDLLRTPLPQVSIGDGVSPSRKKGGPDYLAYLSWTITEDLVLIPIIVFSKPYIEAHVRPSKYGKDLDLGEVDVDETTAHECFHLKQFLTTPWELISDMQRKKRDWRTWNKSTSEVAAARYAAMYHQERTAAKREASTKRFMESMNFEDVRNSGVDVEINY